MKIRIPLLVVFLAMLGMNPAFATAESAQDIVRVTADRVIDRLNAEREQLETNPERIYSLIDELVIPHFDFYNMSRWVLGRQNWRSASEQQQQKFVNEFRTLLVRTYAKALLEYSDEKIDYLPVENNPKSNIVRVKTLVKQAGSKPVPIDYSMHITDGEWKVIDVAVDGISLVATYRGSFASEVRKNGMDSLISKLTERNERLVNNSN
ncbi:MAG TPA: ABC transporter substrate-binding protein [Gammaproteobacteria bacterium]|nr:ABC transporter substrate-binding protein [Gammaproteobacteria bacterium]